MAKKLPLIQVQMPDEPIIGVDMTQQDYNNLQQQGMLPNQLQQPQVVADVSPQSMAVAGANRKGINWGTALASLGSYLNAAGQGMAGSQNIPQAFAQGMGGVTKQRQNIQQFQTMQPYYQQMGYDVSRLDPRFGGAGVASTPESMIQLQSLVDQRNMNNLYRQQMIQAMQEKQQGTQGGKILTVGQLMMLSPEFKARMQSQYDFSGGQNADLLNQQIPASLLQGYMPAKKTNITYGGGVTSKQIKTGKSVIEHKSSGGSSVGKKPSSSKKLIF